MSEEREADAAEDLAPNDPRRMEEVRRLRAVIERGFDVQAFMRSDIGKYFAMRANRELEEAQEALVEADASNAADIRQLQLKAQVAQRVLLWFGEAVTEGEGAEEQYAQVFDESRQN